MSVAVRVHQRTFPVVEVFGPTVQGEGALAGLPTYFVRFGGCDYRCSWCDSMFAVEPALVREHGRKLTTGEILHELDELPAGPVWVTLSGGNPALLELRPLVRNLHRAGAGLKVAVETQGSRWRDWLYSVDHLTVSPKPPSSGMVTNEHIAETRAFMRHAELMPVTRRSLKIVVFDSFDLEWAREQIAAADGWETFLSVGTDPASEWGVQWTKAVSDQEVRRTVGDRFRWLAEAVANDPVFATTRVLPQLHVIAWGHARAV